METKPPCTCYYYYDYCDACYPEGDPQNNALAQTEALPHNAVAQ